jgi:hypothetical protein
MLSDGFPSLRAAEQLFAVNSVPTQIMDNQTHVETLLRQISRLVAERQNLRGQPNRQRELEENRLEIARCQRELNHALIELYGKRAA